MEEAQEDELAVVGRDGEHGADGLDLKQLVAGLADTVVALALEGSAQDSTAHAKERVRSVTHAQGASGSALTGQPSVLQTF